MKTMFCKGQGATGHIQKQSCCKDLYTGGIVAVHVS